MRRDGLSSFVRARSIYTQYTAAEKYIQKVVCITVTHIILFSKASVRKSISAVTVCSSSMWNCYKSLSQWLCPSIWNPPPVRGCVQKEMSFFDGIFLYRPRTMITLPSKVKQRVLNYIILIMRSYQSGPGPVLPAHIVLCSGCNHYFLNDKEKVGG